MDLDELLTSSAPRITAQTPELQRCLDEMVTATEAIQARHRKPVRIAVVGGVLVGALGLGTVASAAGVLPGWPSFPTSSGQACQITVSASALQPGEGEQISSSFTAAEKAAALTEARRFLDDFDYAGVNRDEAVSWWRSEESKVRNSASDPSERSPRLSGDDLEVTAVSFWVVDHLRSHLAAHGLDIRAVAVTVGSGCTL